jgi:hypothetical protein
MNIKNIVLTVSSIGTTLVLVSMNSVNLGLCDKSAYTCRNFFDTTEHVFYFFPIILLFSLITFRLKESVFLAWWKFARIATPLIFIASIIISLGLHHNPGGFFNMDDSIDLIYYFIMYGTFVLGSLVQIYRGQKQK